MPSRFSHGKRKRLSRDANGAPTGYKRGTGVPPVALNMNKFVDRFTATGRRPDPYFKITVWFRPDVLMRPSVKSDISVVAVEAMCALFPV